MTNKTEIAFEDFYSKALHFQSSKYRVQEMCVRTMKEFVKEKDRESAENAVMDALKPFFKEQELEIYRAAKVFVEAYQANDLSK